MISQAGYISSVQPGPSVRTEIGLRSFKARVGRVDDVAAHVAQGPAAEVEDSPPHERRISALEERPLGGRRQPEVPVQFLGHGVVPGPRPPCGQQGRSDTRNGPP